MQPLPTVKGHLNFMTLVNKNICKELAYRFLILYDQNESVSLSFCFDPGHPSSRVLGYVGQSFLDNPEDNQLLFLCEPTIQLP